MKGEKRLAVFHVPHFRFEKTHKQFHLEIDTPRDEKPLKRLACKSFTVNIIFLRTFRLFISSRERKGKCIKPHSSSVLFISYCVNKFLFTKAQF